ncbi:hypothetical protein I2I05_08655 [Hymenobacter sp. BT683]|uniref:Uncharacterized protein n=1 Tax=Hymenobacter jeongseonensis TaxID=2791027 RepID=A0ABS0IGH7_9BACT|nr:hypothetical protein [Hymenobacter jeongseonensis]MBF9237467.1 hypothetical protein [Hymenobacter jeongseonensis]
MYTITWTGAWLSWNTMLSKNRWQRAKLMEDWKPLYRKMFADAGMKPMKNFTIVIRYWSRMDADNVYMKAFIDSLRAEHLVPNDDKRYFGGISCTPDPTLKHNTYVISVI